jgi:hypothetical protein
LSCAFEPFYDGSENLRKQSALYLITPVENHIMRVSQISPDTRFVRRVMTTQHLRDSAGHANRIESA